MSPVEGCPTVFQVICNLSPGHHQVNECLQLKLLNSALYEKLNFHNELRLDMLIFEDINMLEIILCYFLMYCFYKYL